MNKDKIGIRRMNCPGKFFSTFIYFIVFLTPTFFQSTDAAKVFDQKTNQITSSPQPPLLINTNRIGSETTTTASLQNNNGPNAYPISILKKHRVETEQGLDDSMANFRARRNADKFSRKVGSVQNEDDILRLLSMMMQNSRGNLDTENGFSPLFQHAGPSSNFYFTEDSNILEDADPDNYEGDDDDVIELGSFGGKPPPTFHRVSPLAPHPPKMGGHHQQGEKEWLDAPIQLYSHQMGRRNSGHIPLVMKRKQDQSRPSIHRLTITLGGQQQKVEPNIPIFHRVIL